MAVGGGRRGRGNLVIGGGDGRGREGASEREGGREGEGEVEGGGERERLRGKERGGRGGGRGTLSSGAAAATKTT